MNVSDLELTARQRYNAVGETFWSSSEMLGMMYAASLELSTETLCIQRTYTTTTVASQQEYDFPTNTIAIKRITCDGNKLSPIAFSQDDQLTLSNATTAQTGRPQYYTIWNQTIALRPLPDVSTYSIKIYSISQAQALTATSTLEIPTQFHMRLVNFMLAEMYAKDKDVNTSMYYRKLWEKDKIDIKKWVKMRNRTDAFATVKDEESMPETFLGAV